MNKPDSISSQIFTLPGQQVIALAGADALKFSQAQLMNDVTILADGQWQWNGWLTPKGRLIALLIALRIDPQTVWLLPMDADAQALAQRLQQFVFRSKLKIAVRDDLHVNAQFSAPQAASAAQSAVLDNGVVELDLGAGSGPRRLLIGTEASASDTDVEQQWARYDLAHGLPRLAAGQSEHWTPQQLSLDRLRAYSVRKGCYPGQEIVARTHFLGQAKRGLLRVQGQGLAAGMDVFPADTAADPARALGQLVSVTGDQALAVMPLEPAADSFVIAGADARVLPLQDGLQR